MPTPAYPPFFEVIELTGRPVVASADDRREADRDALDLDAIDAALAAGARAVLLCNPHNPTGRVFTRDELEALAAIVDRHGARVVADEVHAPLVYAGHVTCPYATVSDAAAAHTVTVTSASKAFNLAGLKCAQVVVSNHADAARWRELRVLRSRGSDADRDRGVDRAPTAIGGRWLRELVAYLDGNRRLPRPSCWPPNCRRSRSGRRRPRSCRGSTARRSASTTRRASSSTTHASP